MASTVFARNLPFGIDKEEIETIFSDIGPIRKVSIIKEKGRPKSDALTKGIAFIKLYVFGYIREKILFIFVVY